MKPTLVKTIIHSSGNHFFAEFAVTLNKDFCPALFAGV